MAFWRRDTDDANLCLLVQAHREDKGRKVEPCQVGLGTRQHVTMPV